jgi:Esterase PHB depolymerase
MMRRPLHSFVAGGSLCLALVLASAGPALASRAQHPTDPPAAQAATSLPAGLPLHAPPAATDPQPQYPEPPATQWPFSNDFPSTSGSGRLDDGAVLWTSFLFDDHGAALPGDPPASATQDSSALAPFKGSYVYANPNAKNNGADIFRAAIGVDRHYSYWRVDWNTLYDPAVPVAEWAFDTDDNPATGASAWPAGANVRSPGIDLALLVSSRGAWLIDPVTGTTTAVLAHGGTLWVDMTSHSFIVRIPRSLMPVSGRWRVRLAAGVANTAGNGFAPPSIGTADASPSQLPDGLGSKALPAVYDLAFRSISQEPPIYTGSVQDAPESAAGKAISATGPVDVYGVDGASRTVTGNFWMEADQADTLATGNVSKFSLLVDWRGLMRRLRTAQPAPTGYSVRWYTSRFDLGGGYVTGEEGKQSSDQNGVYNNIPTLLSLAQPYAVYVPTDYSPRRPVALTWILHALEANYNQYGGLSPQLIQQLCQDRYSICVMPEGLGPGLDWSGMGQTDFWQVWRAVADAYNIDPNRTTVAGYSMGGSGANILPIAYPDAFAGALVLDGPQPGMTFANVRWVPFVLDESAADELAPQYAAIEEADDFQALGQRYELILHSGGDHIVWATEDRFGDAVAALGDPVRTLDPAVFSYAWTPATTDVADGLGATGDYWIDNLVPRSQSAGASLSVDDEALPNPAVTADSYGPTPIDSPTPGVKEGTTWNYGATPATHPLLSATLTNVAGLSIDTAQARLRSGTIDITTDGATSLGLENLVPGTAVTVNGKTVTGACGAPLALPTGASTIELKQAGPGGCTPGGSGGGGSGRRRRVRSSRR